MSTHKAGTSENVVTSTTGHLAGGVTVVENTPEEGPFDEFFVSREDRQDYGIDYSEDVYWARDPEFWQKRGENVNRVKQLASDPKRGGMAARMVFDKEGDPVHLGGSTAHDLVLMAVPREIMERRQGEIDNASREYQEDFEETDEGFVGYRRDVPKSGDAALDRRMRQESHQNRQMGLIGGNSPTSRMPYLKAERFMASRAAEVEQKQAMLREGGSHTTPPIEDFRALMSGNDRKIHGMGNSGFGRNPNSAVAQAARKGK